MDYGHAPLGCASVAEGTSPASFPAIRTTPRIPAPGVDGSAAPMTNKKRGVKRSTATSILLFNRLILIHVPSEADDVDILSGKALVDTYSKRSYTLLEKVGHIHHSPVDI
jgi:hypothetical protein